MSSRDTFVTSFMYNEKAAEKIAEVMEPLCREVVNHGQWVSGWGKWLASDYEQTLQDCRDALASIDYTIHFELVMIEDDEPLVHQTRDPRGAL